jgi:malonate transporter
VTQLLLVSLLAVFMPGFLLARHHHPHALARDRLWRVMYWLGVITLPVLLASAPIRKAGPAVLAATGCLLCVVAVASAYGRWRYRTSAERTVFTLSAFWPNTGWLGMPVCAVLLGPSSLPAAALYASVASAPHNMLVGGSLAAAHTHRGLAAMRAALLSNRLLLPVLIGLAWAASGIGTFGLGNPARWVAVFSAFPAFVALGLTLGSLNLRPDRDVGAALVLRLGLSPALLIGASLVIHVPEAFLIQAGMATGLNALSMSAEHGLPQGHIARCVAWSTGLVLAVTCVAVAAS